MKLVLLCVILYLGLASAQRGVCYRQTSTVRYRLQLHTRTRSYQRSYSCGWRGWRRCTRTHYVPENYYTQESSTVYMNERVCCPGFTEVRGRCTLPIQTRPMFGHLFGGTPVLVSGPYFAPTDEITCQFGESLVSVTYIDDGQILCVSPRLERIGEFLLTIRVVSNDGATARYDSIFHTVSPDRAHVVDMNSPSLMLQPISPATVTWNPQDIIPDYLPSTRNPVKIDIVLYAQKYTQEEREWTVNWDTATFLASNRPIEDGSTQVFIPPLAISCRLPLHDNTRSIDVGLCPMIVKISVSKEEDTGQFSFPESVGVWSGVMYMKSSFPQPNLRAVCESWGDYEMNSGVTGQNLLGQVSACPPTEAAARNDRTFEEERLTSLYRATSYAQKAMAFFHPGVRTCYRQFTPNSDGVGQQCCYRPNGNLLRGEPAGGSVDLMSPKVDYNRHLSDDLVPYVYCCKAGLSNCNEYYQWRPSGQAQVVYRPPPPPACIFGDPHIITLDGLKYTFNGKGEFTMIETTDSSFTLQGRMDTILDNEGNPTTGTVFTALVAREENTNTTVQFNLQSTDIQIRVNHRIVDLTGVSEIIKENVTVVEGENNTVSAHFKEGAKVEIKVENGIISVMLITLPDSLKANTRGLMGNFNGDSNDDLVPKSETQAIASNSSLEAIHNLFGITWILRSAHESFFTYNSGESFAGFYDPLYNPVFKTEFKDQAIKERAREVCGEDEDCLFDIAATNNFEIGKATMQGAQDFNEIIEMATPVVCDPPCVFGVCVHNNTCSCNEGYEGDTCDTAVMSACETDICQNNGTCVKHVLTVTCECPEGYIGTFCQEKEPPFHIRLVNGSPRVNKKTLLVDFIPSMPVVSAECQLIGSRKTDCTKGHVQYRDLPVGSFIFLVRATSMSGERAAVRRTVHVGESGDAEFCAVHLINEGVVVNGQSASLFFRGTEAVQSYRCKLTGPDKENTDFITCYSPVRYQDLEAGEYRFQVVPAGCSSGKKLTTKFEIH